jgi:hypothetical protein
MDPSADEIATISTFTSTRGSTTSDVMSSFISTGES